MWGEKATSLDRYFKKHITKKCTKRIYHYCINMISIYFVNKHILEIF